MKKLSKLLCSFLLIGVMSVVIFADDPVGGPNPTPPPEGGGCSAISGPETGLPDSIVQILIEIGIFAGNSLP